MQLALLYVKQLKKKVNYESSENENSGIKHQRVGRNLLRIKKQGKTVRGNGPRMGNQESRENQNANKRATYEIKQK